MEREVEIEHECPKCKHVDTWLETVNIEVERDDGKPACPKCEVKLEAYLGK